MNNLIDRVNRLFIWKNRHQYHQESSLSSSSTSSANEYQLESQNQIVNAVNTSWTSTNHNTPTSNCNRHFPINSNAESRPTQHFSSSLNIINGDMSNTQPLLEAASTELSESLPRETASTLVSNQPSISFCLPSRSNSTTTAVPTTAMNFNCGVRVNANEPSSSSSNRHRTRHGRHHRSNRSSRSNRTHSSSTAQTTGNTQQLHLRSFFSSSNRRSSASLLSAPNNGTSNTTNNNPPASNFNHHIAGASSSLNYLFDNIKKRERNLLSACCAVFTIAILSVSLVETRWFYLNGGGCNVNYIGVAHFFAPGRLESQVELSKVTKTDIIMYNFILPNGVVLKNCANKEIMVIMRTIIAFVFMGIFSSCIGLMLDTFGCMKSGIKLIRRHAIFHILTVIFCLAINGFCFWLSERMNEQQIETRTKKGKKIDVSFDVSYYLIVLASGLSIMATAFTLIRRYSTDEDDQLERLLEEYTGFEDPIHLERSLPAAPISSSVNTSSPIQNANGIDEDYFLELLNNGLSGIREPRSSNSNRQNNRYLQTSGNSMQPPPGTPPPPHHHSLVTIDQERGESPPPYDLNPMPVIA